MYAELEKAFTITSTEVGKIAETFRNTMIDGLAGKSTTLKMLPSFFAKPTGKEKGLFVALDFGGTNVRAELVELAAQGRWLVKKRCAIPLKDPAGCYNYISANAQATELFDFIANQVANLVNRKSKYFLGYTFSFPCVQQAINQAVLLNWTKEIRTTGVEGQEVGMLLAEALVRRGLVGVKPCAIINDTVGTLLAAAYADISTDIGAICGTGHNTCYFEPTRDMIINLESGNFASLPATEYDNKLDLASERPGTQRLEKMVAGKYLGEIVRLIAADVLKWKSKPYSLTSEDVAAITLGDFSKNPLFAELTDNKRNLIRLIATLVVNRSARLVAATFIGALTHIDAHLERVHTIAIDGSLYEKLPGYANYLNQALGDVLGDKATMISVKLVKNGSGVGAAVAAALAKKSVRG
jgi:hexokinase